MLRCGALALLAIGLATASARAAPFAYVPTHLDGNVSQYGLGAGGLLMPLAPPAVAIGGSPQGVAVSPDRQPPPRRERDGHIAVDDIAADVAALPSRRRHARDPGDGDVNVGVVDERDPAVLARKRRLGGRQRPKHARHSQRGQEMPTPGASPDSPYPTRTIRPAHGCFSRGW
jgi:hypothetical protein